MSTKAYSVVGDPKGGKLMERLETCLRECPLLLEKIQDAGFNLKAIFACTKP